MFYYVNDQEIYGHKKQQLITLKTWTQMVLK